MRPPFFRRFLLLVTFCLLPLAGCSLRGQPPPTHLYVLTALPQSERAATPGIASSDILGVGPVTLPQYTDRAQIVTGSTNPELNRAPFEQWAEPLDTNF